MTNFLWNIHQDSRISGVQSDASRAQNAASQSKRRIEELEFSLGRMSLVSQALWELVASRIGITEEELLAKISEIDMRDGVMDQRLSKQIISCPHCNRAMNSKALRCIYCGGTLKKAHIFE